MQAGEKAADDACYGKRRAARRQSCRQTGCHRLSEETSWPSDATSYCWPSHPICDILPIHRAGASMTTFDKREEGFEKQFAHDEELKFKATSRRNKLLGLWAAEKLGRKGTDADTYAKEVVMADFEEAGD